MEALRRSSPVPIEIKPIADNADGFFSLDKQSITIREGMSEVQTVSATVHEIAHSKLHNQKKIEEPKNAEKYQEVEIFDVPALFSNGRISLADLPDGLYRYDLRGSDDDPGRPVTVEQNVAVNHAGAIITAKPLDLQEEEPVQAPDNGYMPDPSMSIEAMNAYGYTDSDMLPLSKERALELFERDIPIYMLYDGNTEAMAFETEDIVLFSGCFGITREDWDAVKDQIPPMDMETVRRKREQAFLESPGDTYAIYQLKSDDATADIRFMNSEYLQKKGIEPQYENYELVYTGALNQNGSQIDKLEDLYRIFNIEHPQDFTGHSLSISDIVALKQAGMVSYHYVDSVGYKELANFRNTENYLKNAEMQLEDDFGMIDGIINNGPKEPVKEPTPQKEETKAKKPSVLAKLRQYQKEDREQMTQHRSAERDLI